MTNEYLMTRENARDTTGNEKQLQVVSTALSQPEGNKSNGLTVVISGLIFQILQRQHSCLSLLGGGRCGGGGR